jgi:hypothetical protein
MAENVVHKGMSLNLLTNGVQGGYDQLLKALDVLASSPNLNRPPDVLGAPVKQLEPLYWLSAMPQ